MKNWKGNDKSVFQALSASSHSDRDREKYDFYATEPKAVELLLEKESFTGKIWEPACGQGHISKVLKKHNYQVYSTDIIDRNYGDGVKDFLSIDNLSFDGNIITNPPYRYAYDFILKSLQIIRPYDKIAFFLKIQFLESKQRKYLFRKYPPKIIYVASERLNCAMNGNFEKYKKNSAVCYAWFIWQKDVFETTKIKWIN